ncbi:hypothetical protein Tco_1376864 [Tanacetum coccineum]
MGKGAESESIDAFSWLEVVEKENFGGGDVGGDGVFVSSWVKSTNNCFGGMMLIFGLLEALEMEALVDAMDIDSG